jgi:phage terminase Nu1 subunit (DNA packaging protein)
MLTFGELAAKLGGSRPRLTALVREGLPIVAEGRAKRFDPAAVAAWLQTHGKAVRDAPPPTGAGERICRTRGEAARLLGVSLRVFADWQLDPTFPGKSGPPGRREGYFPVERIADWWAARQGAAGSAGLAGESPRERLLRIRGDQEQIELDKARGDVVAVVAVERLLRRTIATTRAVLAPLADELLQDLPADLPAEIRDQLRRRAVRRLEDAFANIANLLAEEDDEPEEPDNAH